MAASLINQKKVRERQAVAASMAKAIMNKKRKRIKTKSGASMTEVIGDRRAKNSCQYDTDKER